MNRASVLAAALVSWPIVLFGQTGAAPSAPSAVIKTYCLSCHTDRRAAGRLSLATLDADHPDGNPEVWERVVRQLRARTMPPMAAPRPDERSYESTISALTNALDRRASTKPRPLTDTALGVRLAKMLWNSAPDQALLDAASRGALRDPMALQAEVHRLLSDARAVAFVDGFFVPWLSLDTLRTIQGNLALFPEFDGELRDAFRRETALFVQSQLREDAHPADLWTADYTFLNERLARHYGIPNVTGPEYRRVSWPTSDRAGLLAQGSILTLTSRPYVAYPVDMPTTSPAERAKWILTRFLGVDPPATVPNVPPVDFPFDKRASAAEPNLPRDALPCVSPQLLPAGLRVGAFRRARALAS